MSGIGQATTAIVGEKPVIPAMPPLPLDAVRLEGVSKVYGHGADAVPALDSVSLDVAAGEFVCLVGASGCGKSTLLNLIAGLDRPTAGTVTAPGRVALMFQEAALFPWLTVQKNVELPMRLRGIGRTERRDRATRLLESVHLQGFAAKRPFELSGGMRQRVAIARALVSGPRLLLMDEPFGALDEITRDRLNEELLQVWESTGTTILFVTHSIYEAAFLGQEVLLLAARPGRVRELVEVDLPTPRRLPHRESSEFVALAAHLRRVLETC
jgi:NitT/TauT family transport system ATP-binding protein